MSKFSNNDKIISPKILELINNLKIDKVKVLSDFWKQIDVYWRDSIADGLIYLIGQ